MLEFGRDVCGNLAAAETREWLVTNGLGGFASGTVAGLMTRRYHGLLVAALNPPSGRTYLVSKLDETVTYTDREYKLYTNRWAGGNVKPTGYIHIEQFKLDGATPTWTYAFADVQLEKRIWMRQGENSTYVQYRLKRASAPLTLSLRVMVNYRQYHSETYANGWKMDVEPVNHGIRVNAYDGARPIYIFCRKAEVTPHHDWHRRYFLMREANRGNSAVDDHLHAGTVSVTLEPGQSITVVLSTEASPNLDGQAAYQRQKQHEQQCVKQATFDWKQLSCGNSVKQLLLAADQFIVKQPTPGQPNNTAIIAGYHWFGASTRNTMVTIPGLLLTTGRADLAGKILREYAFKVNQGLLPNEYRKSTGDEAQYTAVDATLWYIEVIRQYYETTGNLNFVRELYPALQDIIGWLKQGTHHNLQMDTEDGLLLAHAEGKRLTWMNARIGDHIVTPRYGKPIEINALWYNALRIMAMFARLLGERANHLEAMAEKTCAGFARYWNEESGCCYDVLDTPDGNDGRLRPNQLLAVSLPFSALDESQQKGVVDTCARFLLTSYGVRTLSPLDSAYIGQYDGNANHRDSAYHQGTAWGGLMDFFIQAHLKVYEDWEQALSFLQPMLDQLHTHGIGTISEVFDGNAPFTPHGCIAHAWSVAGLLHACQVLLAAKAGVQAETG